MNRHLSLALALLLAAAHVTAQTPAPAQQTTTPAAPQPRPSQTPTPEDDSEDDVVRITSNLVQFDAVVTDKQGRHVPDLRPEEFEVYLDGRRQEITNFVFVADERGAGRAAAPSPRPDRLVKAAPAPPPPPVPLRAGQVRRTIALVADDLGTSFQDIANVRRALKKFVDEQMQPGDLVAIMRTSAGIGALQQFTTDRQLLYRAIERVRWTPQGRAGIGTFAPIEPSPTASIGSMTGGTPGGDRKGVGAEEDNDDHRTSLEEFREGVFTVGTLGALGFIVRGMRELPDLKKERLALSGIAISSAADEPAPGGAATKGVAARDPLREATVRRFRRGSQIDFVYHVYNAKVERATGRPRLLTQARLFRDGQPVFTGPPVPFDPGQQPNMARLKTGSRLQLGLNLAPGDYVLQLVVTDELAKGGRSTATQWLDFEVVK